MFVPQEKAIFQMTKAIRRAFSHDLKLTTFHSLRLIHETVLSHNDVSSIDDRHGELVEI